MKDFPVAAMAFAGSVDGRLMRMEVTSTNGQSLRLLMDADNAPAMALTLLKSYQETMEGRQEDERMVAIAQSFATMRKLPIQADAAEVVARDVEGVSLLVHLGSTCLHVRVPTARIRALRESLGDAEGKSG